MDTIINLKWDEDDCIRYGIDASDIGKNVFNESNRPIRLWDCAHELKNMNAKILDAGK